MSAWPEKIHYDLSWVGVDKEDILELQHQEHGYNTAHSECSKAAIEMLTELKVILPDYLIMQSPNFKILHDHNAKIDALIETIRGKM